MAARLMGYVSASNTPTIVSPIPESIDADFLIVAGGGGGGNEVAAVVLAAFCVLLVKLVAVELY
jgi:predicted glycosyltransferase